MQFLQKGGKYQILMELNVLMYQVGLGRFQFMETEIFVLIPYINSFVIMGYLVLVNTKMGRSVIAEESIRDFVGNMYGNVQWQIGLIIGQVCIEQ